MGEEYDDFFRREKARCCENIPMPLSHIPIEVKKRKGYNTHDSHYFDYAFECLECGAVYEVIIEDYSYTSIGDFMCPNYTSWSVRPALIYIESHPVESLKLIKEEYLKQSEALDKLIWKLEDKLDKKVNKLESTTGRLGREQVEHAKRRLGKIELKAIGEYEKQQEDMKKTYIEKVRNILKLPPISKKYKKDRLNKYYQAKELKKKLEVKQEQLSSVVKLVSQIDGKDKLLSEIATIKKEIQDLSAMK